MFLIDLLFPKFCLGCGYLGVYLCPTCIKKLKPIEYEVCLYCKKPSLYGLTHPSCINKLGVDGLIVIYFYNPILKRIIKNIKYRLATEIWNDFYKTITLAVFDKLGFYKKLSKDFLIQPIPLSFIRYNQRGFNQAYLISVFFQKFLKFQIVDLLVRKNENVAQAQVKNRADRFKNIKGMFKINKKYKDAQFGRLYNKDIVLIDDVVTSGSTVKEVAKVLKQVGAKKVYVLALARG